MGNASWAFRFRGMTASTAGIASLLPSASAKYADEHRPLLADFVHPARMMCVDKLRTPWSKVRQKILRPKGEFF